MRRLIAGAVAVTMLLAACGGEDDATLTGYRREPAPEVGQFSLPDLTDGGTDFAFQADPGELLVVYFGYTNCPDFCPTTMSDLKFALNRLDDDLADRVEVAMVTVDPGRDIPVLPEYVQGFFPDRGIALGTDDAGDLARAAAPFGVTYDVSENADGDIEVAHSTSLYAVDDDGTLALTWQFGVDIDALATDLRLLLEDETA